MEKQTLMTNQEGNLMKMNMVALVAMLCLGGSTVPSFAEEMGKMKDEIKGDAMGHKDAMKGEMKGKLDDMKRQTDSMKVKGETKAKHDAMKGEMKSKHDDMKAEKGAMGK
jgi:Sec-independent protein translocase protein TatA